MLSLKDASHGMIKNYSVETRVGHRLCTYGEDRLFCFLIGALNALITKFNILNLTSR